MGFYKIPNLAASFKAQLNWHHSYELIHLLHVVLYFYNKIIYIIYEVVLQILTWKIRKIDDLVLYSVEFNLYGELGI